MADEVAIRTIGRPGDYGWVVMAHGEIYAREFGWDERFEALVAKIVGDFAVEHDDLRERGWIAERDGVRLGCVFCMARSSDVAQLRILLVDPAARGHALGRRLVETCVEFATAAGYAEITLWTNDVLASARRIYLDAGFHLVDETRHHSFGVDLTGQNWARRL